MSVIQKSVLVPYSIVQMFDVVNDIASYPQFLENCSDSVILKKEHNNITASLTIKKGAIQQKFTTCNSLEKPTKITMQLVDGPFKKLSGVWSFDKIGAESGTKVSLYLDYEFNSFIIKMTVGAIFDNIWQEIINSFVIRADDIYGDKKL
jgi:ribosome-associated toxin RatA of RatAB toxin-antitoxin module